MNTYLINTIDFSKDRIKELSEYGVVERLSYVFSLYKLTTDIDIEELKSLDYINFISKEETAKLVKVINE